MIFFDNHIPELDDTLRIHRLNKSAKQTTGNKEQFLNIDAVLVEERHRSMAANTPPEMQVQQHTDLTLEQKFDALFANLLVIQGDIKSQKEEILKEIKSENAILVQTIQQKIEPRFGQIERRLCDLESEVSTLKAYKESKDNESRNLRLILKGVPERKNEKMHVTIGNVFLELVLCNVFTKNTRVSSIQITRATAPGCFHHIKPC